MSAIENTLQQDPLLCWHPDLIVPWVSVLSLAPLLPPLLGGVKKIMPSTERDQEPKGFTWLRCEMSEHEVRKSHCGGTQGEDFLEVCIFTALQEKKNADNCSERRR